MARERARQAAVNPGTGEFAEYWHTVETAEGNAVAGVDNVFDYGTKEAALEAVEKLVVETGKPLSVVQYSREVLDTYAAVTRIEKVEPVTDGEA